MAPPVPPGQVSALRDEMRRRLPDQTLPLPRDLEEITRTDVRPVPRLKLFNKKLAFRPDNYWEPKLREPVALARLSFDYEATTVDAADRRPGLTLVEGDKVVTIARDVATENRIRERLDKLGFETVEELGIYEVGGKNREDLVLLGSEDEEDDDATALIEFGYRRVPELRAEGWTIEVDDDYPVHFAEAGDEWYAEIDEGSGIDWFGLELGVMV